MSGPECFFAHLGGCEGPTMVKAHLVPKSRMLTELYFRGVILPSETDPIVWDERCWRWMCGGISRLNGHHGRYDAKKIRLGEPPADLIEFLDEYGLGWMAERYVG
jgi:hypothetical protein